ncbi:MAG: hypothetical protein P8X57_09425 [Cyclobacteriaceae bacterium]
MKPVMLDGKQLVDGGVLNPIPIQHVARVKDDLLVVSDVNADMPIPSRMNREPAIINPRWAAILERWRLYRTQSEAREKGLSYFELVNRSVDLMQDRISDFIIQTMKPDLVIKISRYTCSTFEFHKSESLIACGKEQLINTLKHELQRS